MTEFRLSHAAQSDIVEILAWTDSRFGADARRRYEALLVVALRDAAACRDGVGSAARPELGTGVFSWHLSQSRGRSTGGRVRRPRHVIVYRLDEGWIVIGRVIHEAMDGRRHLDSEETWE